jgi:hypothetical protein
MHASMCAACGVHSWWALHTHMLACHLASVADLAAATVSAAATYRGKELSCSRTPVAGPPLRDTVSTCAFKVAHGVPHHWWPVAWHPTRVHMSARLHVGLQRLPHQPPTAQWKPCTVLDQVGDVRYLLMSQPRVLTRWVPHSSPLLLLVHCSPAATAASPLWTWTRTCCGSRSCRSCSWCTFRAWARAWPVYCASSCWAAGCP